MTVYDQWRELDEGIRQEVDRARRENRQPHTAGLIWAAGALLLENPTLSSNLTPKGRKEESSTDSGVVGRPGPAPWGLVRDRGNSERRESCTH